MSGSLPMLAAIAASAGAIAIVLFRASPRSAFVLWTAVLFLVPIWVGVTVGFFWAAITLVTIAAIAANLRDLRLVPLDGLVAAFALIVVVLFVLRLSALSPTVIALLEWVVPYAWGRIVLARVPGPFVVRALATAGTVVAALAIVEFATSVNVFSTLPGPGPAATWAGLQPRGPFIRAEGAFGHSIALGAALAMCAPFVLASRWRTPVLLVALAIVASATVVTFSRIGILTLATSIALGVALLPGLARRVRWGVALGGLAAAAAVLPFLIDVFAEAGDEAGGSAEYRGGLLSLLSEVQLVGSAGDWSGRVVDGEYLGTYARSVDNTLLVIGVRFGWVPMLLVIGIFLGVVILLLRRGASPASIAVVAQIPALLAVALITQFGMLLWFLVGLAASWDAQAHGPRERAGLVSAAPARAHGAAP